MKKSKFEISLEYFLNGIFAVVYIDNATSMVTEIIFFTLIQ